MRVQEAGMGALARPQEGCASWPLPLLPTLPAGDILIRFRDSITNWAAVKEGGHLEGWDDATPTYLWSGVILDFDLRVREV